MHWISPRERKGLSRLAASRTPPLTEPAPMRVWISSMKRMGYPPFSFFACQPLEHAFDPLLEIAAKFRPGEKRSHVERVNLRSGKQFGHVAGNHPKGQALHDRGFTDARLADQQRIVLPAAAKRLHDALQFGLPSDERIDFPFQGEIIEAGRVVLQGFIADGFPAAAALSFSSAISPTFPREHGLPLSRPPNRRCPCAGRGKDN